MKIKLLFIAVLLSNTIYSQWSTDSTVNNAICVYTGYQTNPKIVTDGAGGAIITWEDSRSGSNYDIYAQRIDVLGVVQWTANGVIICNAANNQANPNIVSDGQGGAIITWQDLRNGSYDVYSQRINSTGVVQWAANGVIICDAAYNQNNPNIVSDGSQGAIITWSDYRTNGNSGNYDVYSQRINSDGTLHWATNGVVVCDITNNSAMAEIASTSDGSAGAIITWVDLRNLNSTSYDIYAQKINSSGVLQWAANGVAICTGNNLQVSPALVTDGNGGAFITWQDERDLYNGNFKSDIYAQKITSNGGLPWTLDGTVICNYTGYQYTPTMVSDGSGGAIITWQDTRNGNYDIYAQRFNSSGNVSWTGNGVPICTYASDQQSPIIISDSAHGAIIVWKDYRNGNWDIYGQKINSSGNIQVATNGLAISAATGIQENPAMVANGTGGAIITWQDLRNGNYDIYVHGTAGSNLLPVELTEFTAASTSSATVVLKWQTATEVSNYGFQVERNKEKEESGWESIGFVNGHGNSNSPKDYTFTDASIPLNASAVNYRLKQIDNDGKYKYSHIVEVQFESPKEYKLSQNYPNPFNPSTVISYSIPKNGKSETSNVKLIVYDILGNEAATLVNKQQTAGNYEVKFDGSKLSSGVYLYKLEAEGKILVNKMIMTK